MTFSDLLTSTNGNNNSFYNNPEYDSLIKKAKSNNLPYILVFEDDAYPCIDCQNKFEQYLKCIPKDASMVILGWSACQKRL